MAYHNGDSSSSSSSPQRTAAPPGFHYMPDGSLMADSEMNAQQRVMGPDDPIMNPQREPCVQQMSCAQGYYWSQRHCNCMTNEELTGPYDFGGPRLANPNSLNPLKRAKPGDTIRKVTKRGNKKIDGWVLTPNGNYITEDVFIDTYDDRSEKVITDFNLDLSDLTTTTETRPLEIIGDDGAGFVLEIKNIAGNYYNFYTQTFASTHSVLDGELDGSLYTNEVVFPASGSDDQYDIFLHAKTGTKHVSHVEKRFGDDSVDLNGSIGSNSLLLQKVIYQYSDKLTLTLQGYSVGGAISGTYGTTTIEVDRYKEQEDTAFSFTTTAVATAAFRVLKQPDEDDVLSFVQPTLSATPIDLPGENIYPTKTATGNTNAVMSSTVTVTMADTIEDLGLKIGDKVIQAIGPFFANIVTVVAISGGGLSANQFTASEAVSVGSGVRLDFYNRMNFSWPVNNYANLIEDGMIVLLDTDIPADTRAQVYSEKVTTSVGTKNERIMVSKIIPAVSTKDLKPTVVKGLVTTQAGDITFNNQLPITLGGTAIEIGGYGESEALRLYGWDVEFSNLAITLTPPTTTTTEATSAHATIAVADREGIINNVSTVSGIGIDPSVANPTLTTGGGLDGPGDWIMSAVQTLENGITLTVGNTGRIATITGNIRINKAGNADQTLRFDVGNLLSTSA